MSSAVAHTFFDIGADPYSSPEIFDDDFIDYLFDLVEQTRYMQDDTFNYSVIKLIVSQSCREVCKLS